MNSLTSIMESYTSLSKNEKKIADYLLGSKDQSYNYTVQQLAEKTGVPPSLLLLSSQPQQLLSHKKLVMIAIRISVLI